MIQNPLKSIPKETKENYWVIIPAAGKGQRMGITTPKQYLSLNNKTILENTLDCFIIHPAIKKIILILSSDDGVWSTLKNPCPEKIVIVEGGEQRYLSVLNGLLYLQNFAKKEDWVLVHDAVRPCLQQSDLNKLIHNLVNHPVGGLLGIPIRDTLKRADAHGNVTSTLERVNTWHALTPQMFRFGKLLPALQTAIANGNTPTDEAAALEAIGEKPLMIEGRSDNIKITYPEDLLLAKKILCFEKEENILC